MPFTLTMPKLSPTMEEGAITKWHKKVGDQVEPGELLIEVSTDKATVEHQTLDGGWLRQILVPEGGEAVVNQPIAIFTESKDDSIEGYIPEGAPAKAVVESAPQLQKSTGDEPAIMTSVPSDRPVDVSAPSAPVKTVLETGRQDEQQAPSNTKHRIIASPLAKKLAAEQGLDLSSVQGTGPGGRIMRRDLLAADPAARKRLKPRAAIGSSVEEPLTPMRKVISQRLQEAKASIPHFYVQQKIDAEPLVALRTQLKACDINVTYNDLIIKASALALKKHPEINSGFSATGKAIVRFKTIDISVAVSIEGGLVTPIVRYADDKDVREISLEVKALAKKAKEGKLQPQEFQGGSFTVSNLGIYGVENFFAIINPPQAAILAISGIADVPAVKGGVVLPGKAMHLSLSVDHRVIDGVAAATFMLTLQRYLENPAILLVPDL